MATVPSMDTFAAGEKVTAAKLNKNVRDTGNFLLSPPRLVVSRGSTQSIPQNVQTNVTFVSEIVDTDNMWAAAAPGSVVLQTPGFYMFSAFVEFAGAVGTYRWAALKSSTFGVFAQSQIPTVGGIGLNLNVSGMIPPQVAGSTVSLVVVHDSTAPINVAFAYLAGHWVAS